MRHSGVRTVVAALITELDPRRRSFQMQGPARFPRPAGRQPAASAVRGYADRSSDGEPQTRAPPCRTYRHFLKRVMSISNMLSGSGPAAPAQSPTAGSPPEGDEGMQDLDFLYFTRDFLAAVAAAATVHTIGVTRAYINARRSPGTASRGADFRDV